MASIAQIATKEDAIKHLQELIDFIKEVPPEAFAFQTTSLIHARIVYGMFRLPIDWKYTGKTVFLSTFPIDGERMNRIRNIIEGKG